MLIFHNATIDCNTDTAKVYQWAISDDEEITFPLGGCTVQHFGGRASITIPVPGRAAIVLDRIKADEPKQQTAGGKDVYLLTGASERIYMAGVDPADAQVSFTILEWSASDGNVAV